MQTAQIALSVEETMESMQKSSQSTIK